MTDSPSSVAVAGEALIDLIRRPDGAYAPCLGGSVYNQARALARQGIPTHYLNPLSADAFGRELAAQLLADGAQLARSLPVQATTSLAVVRTNEAGHPQYAFYREGVADRQVSATSLSADCASLNGVTLACTGGLALDPRDAGVYLPWLRAQRASGLTVAVDVNMRPSVMPDLAAYRTHALAVLQQADVAKVSDEDLGHLQVAGSDPLAQAQALLALSPTLSWLALTLGPDGAWLLRRDGQRWHWREPRALTVVDTVGAGDCFFAGLLAQGLRLGADALAQPDEAQATAMLRHAIAAASLCVQRQGCVPPTWDETSAWRQD